MIKALVKYCLTFLICFSAPLFSAGPILHLWVAQRLCEINKITDPDTLQGIIVGTEFPDIRYISHMPRSLTHPTITDLNEVYRSDTPFELGMKLHAWLDLLREDFITPEVYDAAASDSEGLSATLLKFIEEEILADFYDGRPWSYCFDKTLPEELFFTHEQLIFKWHGMIQWAMSVRPSWLLWAQSFRGPAFGASARTLYNWSYRLPELKRKEVFQHHLHTLLSFIETELEKHPAPTSACLR